MIVFEVKKLLQDNFRRLEIGVEMEFKCIAVCLADVIIDQVPEEIL